MGNRSLRTKIIVVLAYVSFGLFMALVLRNVQLPDEQVGIDASFGSFNAFLQQLAGKRVTTDFQVDYGSAVALLHRQDPYGVSREIFAQFGLPSWDIATANPHPPTTVVAVLPFALLNYQNALSAWSLLMVFATIWTIALMGVRLAYAAPLGVAVCIMFPGAFGIGNVVPVIGLGIALAYRYRDNPLLAAVGLTVAAAPKASGLILLLPFVLTMRWRAVAWTAGFMTVLALIPFAFHPGTWSSYLSGGIEAIALNSAREDNASILNLALKLGIPQPVAVVVLVLVAVGIALLIKDTFWPTVWLIVALLPIAWMYSLLTLIPLFCAAVRRPNPWGVGSVVLATALTVASPPLGLWPTRVLPLIVLLAAVALTQVRETAFWPDRRSIRDFAGRWRPSPASTPDVVAEPGGRAVSRG